VAGAQTVVGSGVAGIIGGVPGIFAPIE